MVDYIDNVGIAVRDLAAAEKFYALLGFEVKSRDQTPGALMAAGNAKLYLFQTRPSRAGQGSGEPAGAPGAAVPGTRRTPELVGNPPGLDHISFWVGDVDGAYRRLKEKGLSFATEPADQEWGARACSLHDPDGNLIFLLGPLTGK